MYQSFKVISVNETEEQYRNDNAFHYSTLATFDRGGFGCLETLFDKKESSSLLFGSAVDTLLTDGEEAFDARFAVSLIEIDKAYKEVVEALFSKYGDKVDFLHSIQAPDILKMAEQKNFYSHWKPETKVKLIIEKGSSYYSELRKCKGKQILDQKTFFCVTEACRALKESEATKFFFQQDNPFEDVERLYQLKFYGIVPKTVIENLDNENIDTVVDSIKVYSGDYPIGISPRMEEELAFSCMADLIVCDHKNKVVYPCDLKTSGHKEYEFHKSFIQWSYQIQARLYWRLIRAAMNQHPVFKDYELKPYTFIVVNKDSLYPLTWTFESTTQIGDIKIADYELRDPFKIAILLNYYLCNYTKVPVGINTTKSNSIEYWLKND